MDIEKVREAAKLADELVGNVTSEYKASQWLGVVQACCYEGQNWVQPATPGIN